MTILSYKGYQVSIEYEDGQLVIQLLHINDFITTTCDSAGEAEAAFHELVDDYLATCEETGRAPDKPYKGSLNIRMLPELHRRAAMAATSAGVSLNAWIVRACEAAMSGPSQSVQTDSRYKSGEHAAGEMSKPGYTMPRAASPESDQGDSPRDNIVDFQELWERNKKKKRDDSIGLSRVASTCGVTPDESLSGSSANLPSQRHLSV
jgi:predicted HicB family RNase H-like nuclease